MSSLILQQHTIHCANTVNTLSRQTQTFMTLLMFHLPAPQLVEYNMSKRESELISTDKCRCVNVQVLFVFILFLFYFVLFISESLMSVHIEFNGRCSFSKHRV